MGTVRSYQERPAQVAARLDMPLEKLTPAAAVAYLERRVAEVGHKTLDMERQAIHAMMRHVTETSMTFITPTPPTISEMLPMAASSRANVCVWRYICPMSGCALCTRTAMRGARRRNSCTSALAAVWCACARMRATIWCTPFCGNRRYAVENGIRTNHSASNGCIPHGGAERNAPRQTVHSRSFSRTDAPMSAFVSAT